MTSSNQPDYTDREELRRQVHNCFKRTKMQQEGDTELFDTELTIDNLVQLTQSYADQRVREADKRTIQALIQDMQLNMRLQFDAHKQDFSTFYSMLSCMNNWVAERLATLNNTEGK